MVATDSYGQLRRLLLQLLLLLLYGVLSTATNDGVGYGDHQATAREFTLVRPCRKGRLMRWHDSERANEQRLAKEERRGGPQTRPRTKTTDEQREQRPIRGCRGLGGDGEGQGWATRARTLVDRGTEGWRSRREEEKKRRSRGRDLEKRLGEETGWRLSVC